jgi:hypothetical protein
MSHAKSRTIYNMIKILLKEAQEKVTSQQAKQILINTIQKYGLFS